MKYKTKVISTATLNKGSGPSWVIGKGEFVEVDLPAGDWATARIGVRGIGLAASTLVYIPKADFEGLPTTPPPVEPPPTTTYPSFPAGSRAGKHLAGLNVITQHDHVWQAGDRGCRTFLIVGTGDALMVGNIKNRYPDATVILRPRPETWKHNPIASGTTPQQVVDYWLYGGVPGCIHILFNEGDSMPMKEPGLRERLAFEVEVAKILKAKNPNLMFAAGGFSMGLPDIDDPADKAALVDILRPAYNAGICGYNSHNYLPDMRAVNDPGSYPFFIGRYKRLFTELGFNPALRNVISDEGGIDNGSNPNGLPVGGFPAQNARDEDVLRWMDVSVQEYNAPVVVGGRSYPNPMVAAVVFCGSRNDPQWIPFDISSRYEVMSSRWR